MSVVSKEGAVSKQASATCDCEGKLNIGQMLGDRGQKKNIWKTTEGRGEYTTQSFIVRCVHGHSRKDRAVAHYTGLPPERNTEDNTKNILQDKERINYGQ